VPAAHVKNGEIVLNISRGATRRLTIDNEWVRFAARFNGASQEVSVPVSAVSGIFAKESGYGFAFTVPADPAASLEAATAPTPGAATDNPPPNGKPRNRPKHLQVVK
jgi:stringent starvation protein B